MKLTLFMLSLSFSTYAFSMDYSGCAKVITGLGYNYSESFFSMDDKTGEIKVNRGKGSMKTEGNNVIYSAFELENKVKESNGVRVITPKRMIDKEELILTYEKIGTDGTPQNLKSISYNLKDSHMRRGGSFQLDLNEKNGVCIPETKKVDLFSGYGKVARFFTNRVFGKITNLTVGAKDIYKCRALHEELKKMDDVKDCMTKAGKLKKLNELTVDLLMNDPKITQKIKDSDIKEYEKKIETAFEAYSSAQSLIGLCDFSGYEDVVGDDAYWLKVNAVTQVDEKESASIPK